MHDIQRAQVEAGERAVVERLRQKGLLEPEPAPVPNKSPAIWDLVIADMAQRDVDGQRKYGTRLQANNGRDALVDAYQEALDLCVYLRQVIEERDGFCASCKADGKTTKAVVTLGDGLRVCDGCWQDMKDDCELIR